MYIFFLNNSRKGHFNLMKKSLKNCFFFKFAALPNLFLQLHPTSLLFLTACFFFYYLFIYFAPASIKMPKKSSKLNAKD